jgi:large subunit ribosomal protein L9
MKVILLEKVKTIGNIGEIVNVSAGHARNFLFPNKLAILADETNANVLKDKQKALSKKMAAEKATAETLKKKIEGTVIEMIKKVGTNGKLFGTVTSTDISKELEKKGIHVERRQITIEGAIKTLGTFDVKAKLFGDVTAELKVKVTIDAAQAEELKKQQAEAQKRNADRKAAKIKAEADAKAEAESKAAEEAAGL